MINNKNSILKQAEFLKGEKKKILTIVSDISKMLMEHNLNLSDNPTYGIGFELSTSGNCIYLTVHNISQEHKMVETHNIYCLNMIFNDDNFDYYWIYEKDKFVEKINKTIDKLNLMKSVVKKYIKLNEKNK
jgi:hypothetical protein